MSGLQVVDNHVIKYIPPEEYHPPRKPPRRLKNEGRYGCLLVGAESADPQIVSAFRTIFNFLL
jgi:large subunit ribosomal protein L3